MFNALFQMAPQALKMRQFQPPMQWAGGSPGWIPNNPGVIFNPQQPHARMWGPMWGQDMAMRGRRGWQIGGQAGQPGMRFNDPTRNWNAMLIR